MLRGGLLNLLLLGILTHWACSSPSRLIPPPPDNVADAGLADAGPFCVDPTNDPANCGACGHACAASDLCVSGECVANVDCIVLGCPTKSWCDTTTGLCRQGCSADDSCGTGRLCDLASHICVPAPDNCFLTPCPAGHTCDSSHACTAGCASDSDCPGASTCVSGSCQPPAPSCRNGTCPGGLYCDASTMKCLPGCDEGAPCPDGASCDPATHVCGARPTEETCLTAACAPGLWCDQETGRCKTGCDGTAACSGGQYCDPLTHQCLTAPVGCPETGCPYGSYCSALHCQAGCLSSADCGYDWSCDAHHQCVPVAPNCSITGCAPGKHCDRRSLACVADCTGASDCGADQTCDQGRCRDVPPSCPEATCPAGTTCDPGDGLCKQSCGGQSCTCDASTQTCTPDCSPASCNGGRYCDATFTCVAGCSDPLYPCSDGKVCNNATHTCATPVFACTTTCVPGTWCNASTGGRCFPGCDANQPCPDGQSCDVATHSCYQRDTCTDPLTACDGACVDLLTSAANCGTCRNVCPTATPACSNGHCIDPCPAQNKTNCDGVCTATTDDDLNCGACGRTCPASAFGCQDSQCVDPCPAQNRTNCDGACIDTSSDGQNCGGCGHTCPASAFGCAASQCVDPCPAQGRTNCGGACVDVQADANNCGMCGQACGGATPYCLQGACATCQRACNGACIGLNDTCVETLRTGELRSIEVAGDDLYVATNLAILALPVQGGQAAVVCETSDAKDIMAIDDQYIYSRSTNAFHTKYYLRACPRAGGTNDFIDVNDSGAYPIGGVASAASNLYYNKGYPEEIWKATKGTWTKSLHIPSAAGLAPQQRAFVDSSNLYFQAFDGAWSIQKAPLAGGSATTLLSVNNDGLGGFFTLHEGMIYALVLESTGSTVRRLPVSGGTATTLATLPDASAIEPFVVDSGHLYWLNRTGQVLKLPLTGGVASTIDSGQTNLFDMAVGPTSIYALTQSSGVKTLLKLTPK